MADKTAIEWTKGDDGKPGASWNILRGCTRKSKGCENCYAEVTAARFCKTGLPFEGLVRITSQGPRWTGKIEMQPEKLTEPLRWTRPRRIFVNSTSDTFLDDVPDWFLDKIFAVMALAPKHTFQVLTKRPDRMLKYLTSSHETVDGELDVREAIAREARAIAASRRKELVPPADASTSYAAAFCPTWPLPNVHLGFSAENQETFDERWPHAEKLGHLGWLIWCSAEPLLSAIDIGKAVQRIPPGTPDRAGSELPETFSVLRWIVAGGESGKPPQKPRPMHPDWAAGLQEQCSAAGIPFFFKQWGAFLPAKVVGHNGFDKDGRPIGGYLEFADQPGVARDIPRQLKPVRLDDSHVAFKVGKKAAGSLLYGRKWDEFPEKLAA